MSLSCRSQECLCTRYFFGLFCIASLRQSLWGASGVSVGEGGWVEGGNERVTADSDSSTDSCVNLPMAKLCGDHIIQTGE